MTIRASLTAAFPEIRRISNFLERDYGEEGVVVSMVGPTAVRLVTHLGITRADAERAAAVLGAL